MTAKRLNEIVGANVRRIRLSAGLTGDAVAMACRPYGGSWTIGAVCDIESGRRAATLTTLMVLSAGLTDATGTPITAEHLLDGTDAVAVTDTVEASLADVRAFMCGQPAALKRTRSPGLSEADLRVIKGIGADRSQAIAAMISLWGRTLSEESILRTRPLNGNAQTRGQVTRALKAELVSALA